MKKINRNCAKMLQAVFLKKILRKFHNSARTLGAILRTCQALSPMQTDREKELKESVLFAWFDDGFKMVESVIMESSLSRLLG